MDQEEIDKTWKAAQAERWERVSWASNYSEIVVISVIVILGTLILWMMS